MPASRRRTSGWASARIWVCTAATMNLPARNGMVAPSWKLSVRRPAPLVRVPSYWKNALSQSKS